MKFKTFYLALAAFCFSSIAIAEDFDLGGQHVVPTITNKMLYDGQKIAVSNAKELFHSSSDPVLGNPNGSVTFVEFIDFACPRCEGMDPAVQNLIKANPQLRVVYKEYPIRGEASVFAAKAALAAQLQGKYETFHIALMRAGKSLSESKVLQVAKSVGLNIDQLKTDMKSYAINQHIQSTKQLGHQIGILGTPALFFAKSNISSNENPNVVLFMMGEFGQADLQSAVNKFNK